MMGSAGVVWNDTGLDNDNVKGTDGQGLGVIRNSHGKITATYGGTRTVAHLVSANEDRSRSTSACALVGGHDKDGGTVTQLIP